MTILAVTAVTIAGCGGPPPSVDQHRPGGDGIDRDVRHAGQAVGGGQHEAAPAEQPFGVGGLAAVIKQVLGDVGEDHPA